MLRHVLLTRDKSNADAKDSWHVLLSPATKAFLARHVEELRGRPVIVNGRRDLLKIPLIRDSPSEPIDLG